MYELTALAEPVDESIWPADCAVGLRLAIEDASSWDRLGELCSEAEDQYREGNLTLGQTEELAQLAVDAARLLESAGLKEHQVTAADLIPQAGDVCAACGQSSWWYAQGEKICSVCHPHPGLQVASARSAA